MKWGRGGNQQNARYHHGSSVLPRESGRQGGPRTAGFSCLGCEALGCVAASSASGFDESHVQERPGSLHAGGPRGSDRALPEQRRALSRCEGSSIMSATELLPHKPGPANSPGKHKGTLGSGRTER